MEADGCYEKVNMSSEDITCIVCMELYDQTSHAPKVLSCGHSVCSVCVGKLLGTTHKCPECSTTIERSNCPINYGLLRIISNTNFDHENYKERILTSLRSKIESIKSILSQQKVLYIDVQSKVKMWDATVEEMCDQSAKSGIDVSKVKKMRAEVDGALKSFYTANAQMFESTAIYNYMYMSTNSDYLIKVFQSLRNGTDIYAFTSDDQGRDLYGKVTGEESLHIHCLSYNKPSIDAILIKLSMLEKCANHKSVFLNFVWNGNSQENSLSTRVYITLNTEDFAQQFYFLCSGELGVTFSGIKFNNTKSYLELPNYRNLQSVTFSRLDFLPVDVSNIKCSGPDNKTFIAHLYGARDESGGSYYSIHKKNLGGQYYLLGSIEKGYFSLSSIQANFGRVEDCGIFICSQNFP